MAITSRGKKGRFTKSIETAQRDADAARLRARGLGYLEIAEQLGYQDASGAYRAVQRALVSTVAEPAEEVRALQLTQLDALALAALTVLERDHVTVSHGHIVHGDDGMPVLDDGPVLAAIDRLLRIQERRAKLLGLDAPTKHEVVTLDAIDAEIARLTAALAGGAETAEAAASAGPEG